MLQKYDGVIQDQLSQGIVERVHSEPEGKEFYIQHKAVIRETAESTKIRIVYDASTWPETLRGREFKVSQVMRSLVDDEQLSLKIWTFDWDILSIFAFIVVASPIIHICHCNRSVK